jgi:hypothetical protein
MSIEIIIGFTIIALIAVIRITLNIRNGKKWWEGFPTGE